MTRMRVLTGHNKIPVSQPVWRGNARMTEVTATIAVPQLRKLDQLVRDLQALQRQVVTELTEESVADRVVPDAGDLEWHGLGAAAVVFKPYPCNHFTHAGVDAALRLRAQGLAPPTSQRSSWASPSPSCARSPSHPRPRHGRPPGTTRRSAAPTRSPRRCSAAASACPTRTSPTPPPVTPAASPWPPWCAASRTSAAARRSRTPSPPSRA